MWDLLAQNFEVLTCEGDAGAGEAGAWRCVVSAKGCWCKRPETGVKGPFAGLSGFGMSTGGGNGGGGSTELCFCGDLGGGK